MTCINFLIERRKNKFHLYSWLKLANFDWQTSKEKSLEIFWVVSKLFSLSHLEQIDFYFLFWSNSIVEMVENHVYLFRNPLSLICEILGFRHYFGNSYSFFFQKSSNIPFLFFLFPSIKHFPLLEKSNMNDWFW